MTTAEKAVTLVIRQSKWSPNPETILEETMTQHDSKIVNMNLLGVTMTSRVIRALTKTLMMKKQKSSTSPHRHWRRSRNDTTSDVTTPKLWNQIHFHQCQIVDDTTSTNAEHDCSELCRALTMNVNSLILSGSSELLSAMLLTILEQSQEPKNNDNNTRINSHDCDGKNMTMIQKLTINEPRKGLIETQCLKLGRLLACTRRTGTSWTRNLQHLSLKGTKIRAPGLLAPGLSNATNLQQLILSDTGLDDQGQADLVVSLDHQYGIGAVQRLLQYGNLTALDLSNLHLEDGHAIKLFQSLDEYNNSCLEQLNLSFNDITCKGIIGLSEFLPRVQRLSKLSLKPNPWRAKGAKALLSAMQTNTSIEYLDSLLLIEEAPLLRYYTSLNRGGRRILMHQDHDKDNIPLGLWPIILERAGKISYHYEQPRCPKAKFQVMYHLLRNGNFLSTAKKINESRVV